MHKINIYVLHLKQGGVESATINLANMLADNFKVEIISFYNYGDIPYEIDNRVKVTFLTNYQSNKEDLKISLKTGKRLFYNIWLALNIFYKRRRLIKKHISKNTADVLISTRLLYHDLVANVNQKAVKICQEHVDHKENKKYIRNVIKSTRNADYLMPVSQFLADSYEIRLKKNKIRPIVKYIKHAVELPKKIRYEFSKNLISVGRLSPEKGFIDLVDLMNIIVKKDSEYKIHIIGDGTERKNIEKEIKKYGLENNIIMHGFIPKKDVIKEMQKASLYILPSFEESFGLVIIESFSCGVPVVAFNSARGAVEILNDNKAGKLIENRDIDKMADWILNFNEDQGQEMSRTALKTAKLYDFDIIKTETINFIKNAIRSKHDS